MPRNRNRLAVAVTGQRLSIEADRPLDGVRPVVEELDAQEPRAMLENPRKTVLEMISELNEQGCLSHSR